MKLSAVVKLQNDLRISGTFDWFCIFFLKKSCSSVSLQIHVTFQLFCTMKHVINTNVDLAAAFQSSSIQQNVGKETRKNLYELSKNGGARFVRRGHISLLGQQK